MGQYRKKPVVIEAMHYLPSCRHNEDVPLYEILRKDSMDDDAKIYREAEEVQNWLRTGGAIFACVNDAMHGPCIEIDTLEGQMLARPGDWIIKGVKGEFYPCKPDIFAATYEEVQADEA